MRLLKNAHAKKNMLTHEKFEDAHVGKEMLTHEIKDKNLPGERNPTGRSSGLGGLAPMKVGRFFLVCFVRWVAKSVETPKPLNAGVRLKKEE